MAWAQGLLQSDAPKRAGRPIKHEGDGRSPAGAFYLKEATGYAPTPPSGATLKYHAATQQLRCVDDPESSSYNQIVNLHDNEKPTWSSDEQMRRSDALYELTIIVEYNRAPIARGAGSCHFLHVTSGFPTAGCTAMPLDALRALLVWLRAEAHPILVQLPRHTYELIRDANLPPFN